MPLAYCSTLRVKFLSITSFYLACLPVWFRLSAATVVGFGFNASQV